MEASFAITFSIQKGLGPDRFTKTIEVGLDDIDPETTNAELRKTAVWMAEQQLYKSEDFQVYGKNWEVIDIHRT